MCTASGCSVHQLLSVCLFHTFIKKNTTHLLYCEEVEMLLDEMKTTKVSLKSTERDENALPKQLASKKYCTDFNCDFKIGLHN